MSMNKINIDGVLIVEGNNDVSYLSSFVNALFFVTNGYDLNEKKIDLLQRAAKVNKLIIFTDPDEAGEKIKEKLKSCISPIFDTKIEKNYRKNTKKYGVAELTKESVIKALDPFTVKDPIEYERYDLVGLSSLKRNDNIKSFIIEKYRLIGGNNKAIENQLRILKVSAKEILEITSGN